MGECGCAEDNAEYRIDAPDGHYGIGIYGGCPYCLTPIAVDIYRYDDEYAADFLDGVPAVPIQPYGDQITNGIFARPLLDPALFIAVMQKRFPDVEMDQRDALDVLQETMERTVSEWKAAAR